VRTVFSLLCRFAFLAALGVIGWFLVDAYVPSRHLPWKPVDLTQPPGLATSTQMRQLAEDRYTCIQALKEAGVEAESVENSDDGGFCAITNAVRLRSGVTPVSGELIMSCPMAAAYVVWDREVLQPAALETLGSEVAQITSFGSYACRRMYGRGDQKPSQHAQANAVDVGAFRLKDGRTITVLEGWSKVGPESDFLHAIRDGGCRVFRTVLSPDFNAEHADHLHMDMDERGFCPLGPQAPRPAPPAPAAPAEP
jgi:hypothetical protein